MEIINILHNNQSPEYTEALFKTLVNTSEAIDKENVKAVPEEIKEEIEGADRKEKKEPKIAYDR